MNGDTNYLMHHGITGMRWGIRRWQNEDGTYTPEGRKRYGYGASVTEVGAAVASRKRVKNAVRTAIRRTVKAVSSKEPDPKKEDQDKAFDARHKPTSKMTDQELRDAYNRLNMERSLKQVRDDLDGANKPKKTFAQKHPVIQQLAVNTTLNVASNLITSQLKTKADEWLAPKRMERAKEKGMLNKDMFPFVYNNSGRITSYNNGEKAKADAEAQVLKRIETAVTEEREAGAKNIKKAVELIREEAKTTASSAVRDANASYDRRVRDAVESVRSGIKKGRNAKARSAKQSVLDDLLKELYGKKG